MAVDADHCLADVWHPFEEKLDQLAKLPRVAVADGIGNVDGSGAGFDDPLDDFGQEIFAGSGSVLGRKLNVITERFSLLDGLDCHSCDLGWRLAEFLLHVNVAGGDKGVNTRPRSAGQSANG